VRYRIDCIGDAIDPALHNMPMSQSEIKRKKNLSLSQPVSVYTANATISVANQLCCNAATIQGGRIAVRRPFPAESRALRAVHDIRFIFNGTAAECPADCHERYDHFILSQGRTAKIFGQTGAAGRLTGRSPGNFLDAVTVRPAFSCV
jgi:hypothetical protein